MVLNTPACRLSQPVALRLTVHPFGVPLHRRVYRDPHNTAVAYLIILWYTRSTITAQMVYYTSIGVRLLLKGIMERPVETTRTSELCSAREAPVLTSLKCRGCILVSRFSVLTCADITIHTKALNIPKVIFWVDPISTLTALFVCNASLLSRKPRF